ncbi:MAG: adenylate/guanylate cyclase domain-containing protein [Chloroflexota bacterium]
MQPAEITGHATTPLTFLIADVRDYTRFTLEHGDQAAAHLATRLAEVVEDVVGRREGRVIELRGDEVLTVFTSPRQALRAAVELQARFVEEDRRDPSLPLRVGIGLDAGEVIAVQTGYRGAALNLAARLCSLAGPGEVLASDGLVHLAGKMDGVEYAERGLVQLKGFANPVKAVQLFPQTPLLPAPAKGGELEVKRPAQSLPIGGFLGALPGGPLIARDTEFNRILTSIEQVAAGEGRILMLAGEPGVGKTRLAQEVTLDVRNRGFLVATGSCYEPRQAVPYYPFLDMLATLYEAAPGHIRSVVSTRWPYLGRLLPETSIPFPTSTSDSQEEQERLFRAVAGFVQAIAQALPVALLLDDLQWADGSSLGLLQHLARHTRGSRVLVLGTYRDVEVGRRHPLERALRDLHRDGLVERMAVQRLGKEGTAGLMATNFGTENVSPEFAELVHRHTEGNAFFTYEVLQALVDRGDIYQVNGHWEQRTVNEIDVPESIRSTIGERLSRLSEPAQNILLEASTLGQTFAFDDLHAVGRHPEEDVEEALEEAIAAGLVRVREHDVYAFNHALTQQALYADLTPRRKRRLHLAAGDALEQLPERQRHKRTPELAWHFLQGDDSERALAYAMLAGIQAEAVFAHVEAEQQFRTAVELARAVGDHAQETKALAGLGVVQAITGHHDEALETLEQALAVRADARDLEVQIQITVEIGRVHWWRGTPEEGIGRIQSLLPLLPPGKPSKGLAALHLALADLYYGCGKYQEVLHAARASAELARAVDDKPLLAKSEMWHGTVSALVGNMAEGRQALETSIALAESAGDLTTLGTALNNLGDAYLKMGVLDQSKFYLERSLETRERIGALGPTGFQLVNLGEALVYLGEWERAYELIQQGDEVIRAVGGSWWSPYAPLYRGILRMCQGKWEDAFRELNDSKALSEPSGDLYALEYANWHLGELELLEGKPEAAHARLQPLVKVEGPHVAGMLSTLACAYVALGQTDRAEEMVMQGLTIARQRGHSLHIPAVLRVHGIILAGQERWEEAENAFQESISLAHSMPFPYATALALHECGHMHRQRGNPEQAGKHLSEALGIFRHLGATRDMTRTEQELAALG